MAYITKEQVKEKRELLKKKFPSKDGWKLSVTGRDFSVLQVSIMKSPFKLVDKGYEQINHYYIDGNYDPAVSKVFKEIIDIAMEGNFDKSDSQIDYFHVGYYFQLSVGKWDKDTIVADK